VIRGQIPIGVFYDGGWFAHVSDYYAHHHPWHARISLQGLHDVLRWHVHDVLGAPLEDCVVCEGHYVRGRSATPSRSFEGILEQAGIERHDAELGEHGEKGADVLLALVAWDRAISAPLRAVALITGDADLVPLASRLRARGVHMAIPVVDAEFTDEGEHRVLRTAPRLAEAASSAPPLSDLLAAGLTPSWPLSYPFVIPASMPQPAAVAASERRRGTITRWEAGGTSGFITEAVTGASWFVSRDDLPGGAQALTPGTSVTFTGSPRPKPGKRYPRAYAIGTPAAPEEMP
jgi:hypothetical protein